MKTLLLLSLLLLPVSYSLLLSPTLSNYPTVIEDATCNVQDLEEANDSQLHSILKDLRETQFFSHFEVNLNKHCPLFEEDFECQSEEIEGPPLCSIESNALFTLSQDGFQSQSQKETYTWQTHSDQIVQEHDCDDEDLPDTFWLDVCQHFQDPDNHLINLALNPERNTAYNGTHIWKAIYEENCIKSDTDMCLEERVLYRLLSGLHSSTTLSIAKYYYPPSKRKGRTQWEPNPEYFMQKFDNQPEHIRNLHFSYVVLLRALRKASEYLRQYDIHTGDSMQDLKATVLLHRLLDSGILNSCSSVFSAFDESLMFKDDGLALQQNFKGVFHNVSSILDCVQCQQCKLHGKLAMLGYGTALKILFIKPEHLDLSKNEVVAFINTVAKFSESIREVRELTDLYWATHKKETDSVSTISSGSSVDSVELLDVAIGAIAGLGRQGALTWSQEQQLVEMALKRQSELLILAKHYGNDLERFHTVVLSLLGASNEDEPDAIIVGSGLAGLAAALNILDRGGSVVIVEKEHLLGGNSNKASSGINAYIPDEADSDSIEIFKNDTTRSAGVSAHDDLIQVLIEKSGQAVTWLRDRVGVDLSLKAQLGGHSAKRTHRPKNGMAGAEIIYGMQKAVKAYEKTGKVKILLDSKVTKFITSDDGAVLGVQYVSTKGGDSEPFEIRAPNTVLATGGFAADRSKGSLMEKYRPEYLSIPTTAGAFSTGDGVALATSLGAGIVDMDKIQIHPTGWVDPADPESTTKTLAAELMRGVGGILLNDKGSRFCNELGTRAYVTDKMLLHDPKYAKSGNWSVDSKLPNFFLVLSSSAAEDGKKHVDLYTHKGLMTELHGVSALANWMGVSERAVTATLSQYQKDAEKGSDAFGKTVFRGVPMKNLRNETFYAGRTTPVAHYCMGGITIDTEGSVLNENGQRIPGLHAAGEVTGGVHGVNRLAGNSLLECTVYGTIVGQKLPIKSASNAFSPANPPDQKAGADEKKEFRSVSMAELSQHSTPDDCWVAIHGIVYDLTDFAEEHPAGAESILELAGKDGTAAFAAVHNERIMEDFDEERIGILVEEDHNEEGDEEEEDCSACQVQMDPFPFS